MAEFPVSFTEEPVLIMPPNIDARVGGALQRLSDRGVGVIVGLRRQDVAGLTEIAGQPAVMEYCPNDLKNRWTDVEAAERQLSKNNGRGVFRLVNLSESINPADGKTIGYGWVGRSSEDEKQFLPDCENTFAVRLHESVAGQGLAKPFTELIVAGAKSYFRARRIGLETWGSNHAAVRTYLGAGAVLKAVHDDTRPTLNPDWADLKIDDKMYRRDTRLYMQFAQSIR